MRHKRRKPGVARRLSAVAAYRAAARRLYHEEGIVEVDDRAIVSRTRGGDPGAYVQAWVWVPEDEVAP